MNSQPSGPASSETITAPQHAPPAAAATGSATASSAGSSSTTASVSSCATKREICYCITTILHVNCLPAPGCSKETSPSSCESQLPPAASRSSPPHHAPRTTHKPQKCTHHDGRSQPPHRRSSRAHTRWYSRRRAKAAETGGKLAGGTRRAGL